jgi:hypothetical protein
MVSVTRLAWSCLETLVNKDPNTIVREQLVELHFPQTGTTCSSPCPHSRKLIARHLKKGDKFVLMNNAGVTERQPSTKVPR